MRVPGVFFRDAGGAGEGFLDDSAEFAPDFPPAPE